MASQKLKRAVLKAITSDLLDKLVYEESLKSYVLPDGAIFSISPSIRDIAKEAIED